MKSFKHGVLDAFSFDIIVEFFFFNKIFQFDYKIFSRASVQPQVTNSQIIPFTNSSIAHGGWHYILQGHFRGDLGLLTDTECHWMVF